jgi:hypothetical protein
MKNLHAWIAACFNFKPSIAVIPNAWPPAWLAGAHPLRFWRYASPQACLAAWTPALPGPPRMGGKKRGPFCNPQIPPQTRHARCRVSEPWQNPQHPLPGRKFQKEARLFYRVFRFFYAAIALEGSNFD